MLANIFLSFVTLLVSGLASVLPAPSALPAAVNDWIGFFRTALSVFGWIFPFDTLMTILSLTFKIEIFVVVPFLIAQWLYNKIRGSG